MQNTNSTFPNSPIDEINFGGFLRGVVVEDVDPEMNGKLGISIPRLMEGYNAKNTSDTKIYPFMSGGNSGGNLYDPEFSDVKESTTAVEVADYIWAMPAFPVAPSADAKGISSFALPVKGQVVFCFMEDEDPQKLYWLPITPTLENEPITFQNMLITLSKKNDKVPEKFRNIIKIMQAPNGNVLGFDYNEDTNSFEITFSSGSSISIQENDQTKEIRLSNEENVIIMDKLHKKLSISTNGDLSANAKGNIDVKADGSVRLKGSKVYIN